MIRGLLADANAEGHLASLLRIYSGPGWDVFWRDFQIGAFTLRDFNLLPNIVDSDLWHFCQRENLILLTANRNGDRSDSLESTIRARGLATSLPVITIADAFRLGLDSGYRERAAVRLLEILLEIDALRGTGRLFIPNAPLR